MEQRYRRKYAPQAIRHPHAPQVNTPPSVSGPLIARFVEEDNAEYLVGDPWSSRTAHVPKRRAYIEISSLQRRQRQPSERMLRWSSYALVGAVCGGIAGIALGAIVSLATLLRLARLSRRIHQWQRSQEASGKWTALPTEATRERGQLLAALGQSFLGMLLGGGVLYAILVMR